MVRQAHHERGETIRNLWVRDRSSSAGHLQEYGIVIPRLCEESRTSTGAPRRHGGHPIVQEYQQDMGTAEFETARLLLLPWDDEYLEDLVRIYADPEVMKYISGGRPLPRAGGVEQSDRVRRLWEEHGFGPWAAIDKRSGRWVGKIGLDFLQDWPGHHKWEVGWELDPEFWGQGLATEGGRAGVQFGFEKLELGRIISVTVLENNASRRVMEKCGLTDQGLTEWRGAEVVWYAIEKENWRPVTTPNQDTTQ